jgi:uracil-DNA glycosylase family 4
MKLKEDVYNFSETDETLRYKTFKEVEKVCQTCQKCRLAQTRTKVVFGEGVFNSKILLIGEGPGREEDETGRPFVGKAGKLLDQILASQDISREKNIFIANIVKCRPPENRNPQDDEAQACRQYLDAQIQLLRPKIILLAGAVAVKNVLGAKEGISKIRGQWFDGPFGSKIMPIFHPSYLLRNQSKEPGSPKWLMWQDIKEIRRVLDGL